MEANPPFSFYDFVALPRVNQLAELWQHGVHLQVLEEGPYRFRLYRLHGFYVEVSSKAGSDIALDVRAFLGGSPLNRYLEQTDLSDLYNP